MKIIRFCLVLLPAFGLAFTTNAQRQITISNNTSVARINEVVSIPWKDIVRTDKSIDTSMLLITEAVTKRAVPCQFETQGTGQIQDLLLQVSVPAKSKIIIQIKQGKPVRFASKTYSRYIPERKDDFAWENDKIAFRAYGKALEGTSEDAHGFDVWVKKTDEMVIDRRYKRDDYHVDHGDGLDYYNVGLTLGAGSVAPYAGDSVCYSGNYRQWKILDNGPLRSTFQLIYEPWKVQGQEVSLVLTLSIDAGSQLHRVEGVYQFSGMDSMRAVIGIIKRKEAGSSLLDEKEHLLGYWEPEDKQHGTTGVGCIVPDESGEMLVTETQHLSFFYVHPGKKFTYYRGAAWDKAGSITSSTSWFDYLSRFGNQLKNPLAVTVR